MTVRTTTRVTAVALTLAFAALVVLSATTSQPRAHAQAQNGDIIQFDECRVVSLEVLDSDAFFTSVFWRFGPGPEVGLGFNNQQVGQVVNIGEVPANTELILGIVVDNTGNIFKTGPGDRNPDNAVHATIGAIGPDIVGFEDKAVGEPDADFDYDDAVVQITTEPCDIPVPQVTLTLEIDPASTGTGGLAGGGTFPLGTVANAVASPDAGSTFGGWSQDCGGFGTSTAVVMDANKLCVALFLAEATATPVATPTEAPPIAGPPPAIGIANTRTSASPANVGDTVVFRIDVSLADVPATNEAEVLITYDDTLLEYVGTLTSQCALFPVGIVCDFGTASAGFSFDLDFTALAATASTATNATLGADYDGAGPGAAETAGPAPAEVAIVDVAGIQLPPLGDGSVSSLGGSTTTGPLAAALGVIVLGIVTGAGFGASRRRAGGDR